jgi:xanthine/uracil/vitamin C permease (AzgA family)
MKKAPLIIYALFCIALVVTLNSCVPDEATKHPFIVFDNSLMSEHVQIYCDKAESLSPTRVQCVLGVDTFVIESDKALYIKSNIYYK